MVREPIPVHVRIKRLLKERPHSREEMMKILKISENTLDGNLKRMRDWGEVKKLDDGRYADIYFQDEDEQVIKVLKEWDIQSFDDDEFNVVISSQWRDIAKLSGLNPEDSKSFNKIMEIAKKLRNQKSMRK